MVTRLGLIWEAGEIGCRFTLDENVCRVLGFSRSPCAWYDREASVIHSERPDETSKCLLGDSAKATRKMIRSYKGVSPKIPGTCYVDDSAQVIGDVTLGENASIWMNAVVRGDVHYIRIGANSNIQDCSVLHGMLGQWPVEVGEWVTVGHNVTLHGCVVEDRCLVGMGVIVLNGARIGEGSILAAGTLIPEKVVIPPRSLVMGAPGKVRRQLDHSDQETILRYARNYLGYREQYLSERR